ncbi:hypothetical protein [Methanococcoides alaskense]|uniref:Uncharacterized protein n=1 Tax=Methanococcoides alaskense TaxID=325778 RepID=A0AA90U181_9EURY|nr:hypothetical protein [Methanococcoides alaskense]MDR6223796.1 hypothetical protein [Methanococcoides alaskense]
MRGVEFDPLQPPSKSRSNMPSYSKENMTASIPGRATAANLKAHVAFWKYVAPTA